MTRLPILFPLILPALLPACELGAVEEQSEVSTPYSLAAEVVDKCWFQSFAGPKHWEATYIPVYINVSTEHGVDHSGHSVWNFAWSVENAVSVWNEDSGTPLRLRYMGATTEIEEPGAIVIRSESDGTCWRGGGTGLTTSDLSTGIITAGRVSVSDCDRNFGGTAGHVGNPDKLVDLLVHEIGHTLGRTDAYDPLFAECGGDTIMYQNQQALTAHDKQQHQALYGSRTATPVIRARALGWPWDEPEELPITGALYRLNPGSSYDAFYNVLAYPRDVGDGTTDVLTNRLVYGSLSDVADLGIETHNPIASAMGPDGEGLIAYQRESAGGLRYVCYRRTSDHGASFAAESCFTTSYRSGVSAAYDPVSRYLLVGFVDTSKHPAVRIIPITASRFVQPQTRKLSGEYTTDAPGIACASSFSFDNHNCRLVWGNAKQYGQRVRWLEFEIPLGGGWLTGATRSSSIPSDEAPAVTWFDGKFQLAVVRHNQYIARYDMPRFGTYWSWRENLNTTGYVSAPSLVTERICLYGCIEQMYAHWLRYE